MPQRRLPHRLPRRRRSRMPRRNVVKDPLRRRQRVVRRIHARRRTRRIDKSHRKKPRRLRPRRKIHAVVIPHRRHHLRRRRLARRDKLRPTRDPPHQPARVVATRRHPRHEKRHARIQPRRRDRLRPALARPVDHHRPPIPLRLRRQHIERPHQPQIHAEKINRLPRRAPRPPVVLQRPRRQRLVKRLRLPVRQPVRVQVHRQRPLLRPPRRPAQIRAVHPGPVHREHDRQTLRLRADRPCQIGGYAGAHAVRLHVKHLHPVPRRLHRCEPSVHRHRRQRR